MFTTSEKDHISLFRICCSLVRANQADSQQILVSSWFLWESLTSVELSSYYLSYLHVIQKSNKEKAGADYFKQKLWAKRIIDIFLNWLISTIDTLKTHIRMNWYTSQFTVSILLFTCCLLCCHSMPASFINVASLLH